MFQHICVVAYFVYFKSDLKEALKSLSKCLITFKNVGRKLWFIIALSYYLVLSFSKVGQEDIFDAYTHNNTIKPMSENNY